jgi:uncharacterized membrane protein YhfC
MGLSIAFVIAILVEIALPVFLVIYLIRKTGISWFVVVIGVMTYMIVQIIQTPILGWLAGSLEINQIAINGGWKPVLDGVVLGVVVGIIAEGTRWGAFKFVKQLERKPSHAIGVGLGYGASETIILVGLPVVISFLNMLVYKNASIGDTSLPEGLIAQVQTLWQLPWHTPLIGAFERVTALITHVTMSVMILQVFTKSKLKFLFFAMAWHAVIEAIPVILNGYGVQTWAIDLVLLGFSIMNIYLLKRFGIFDKTNYKVTNTIEKVEAGG